MRGITLIICAIVFISCQNGYSGERKTINGIWESIGSGWILEIKDSSYYSFYDITSISCIPNTSGDSLTFINDMSLKHDTLSLMKGVIRYQFKRLNSLPNLCASNLMMRDSNDVKYNFEIFASVVKDNYAFFKENNIDWETIYKQQRNKLNQQSNQVQLYKVIDETLEMLNDNHAYLEADQVILEQLDNVESNNEKINDSDNIEIGDFEIAQSVLDSYLEKNMTKDSWLIGWGMMNDSVGYVQIKSMWLYADLEIPRSLIEEFGYVDAYMKTFSKMYEGDYIQKEVTGVSKIMDKVMMDLLDTKSIILDVRFNGGGQDAVSFEILRRFLSGSKEVAKQKLFYNGLYTDDFHLLIEGDETPYLNPVYILTSPQTGSAAEAFALATLEMSNAKRIGSNSSGAMSTALEKKLPNGWSFSISNEVYMGLNGKSYEYFGVPIDYELNYSRDRQVFFKYIMDNLDRDKEMILKAISEF